MAIEPIAHNPQVQPLTVVLRNICRDYPAGGGILHELLQNADDAGATVVRFALDQKSYSTGDLINPELAAYQGPALLAYNNAMFTERDFRSLGRLGDSLKIDDGSTTGKFGRGFNSVFNWTDSPSIISGHQFLILDPHHDWSNGGPIYDYVKSAEEPKMKSHMEAFQSVMTDTTQPLDGTVIRIPLRTSAQAKKSNIGNRETTTSEILEVLRKFADNFGPNGLLFLRNVEQIHIECSTNLSIKFELLNLDKLRPHRQKIQDATKRALIYPNVKFEHSFEVQVKRQDAQQAHQTYFVVHHAIQSELKDKKMQKWMEEQKLIPWVAVAAQVPKLFVDLCTQFYPFRFHHANQSISMLCSVSHLTEQDCTKVGKNVQDNDPAKWNDMLLRVAIPSAWTSLLGYLSRCDSAQSSFLWWPKELTDSGNLFSNMIGDFIDIVDRNSLPLWPTDTGYVEPRTGLLSVDDHDEGIKSALRDARVPAIYAPAYIQRRVKPIFLKNFLDKRVLKPRTIYKFLSQPAPEVNKPVHLWLPSTRNTLLEYFLLEQGFLGFATLPIFRFADGEYRSAAGYKTLVNRNHFEAELFSQDKKHTLDVATLSASAKSSLEKGFVKSNKHSLIRYRSEADFKSYCLDFVFQNVRQTDDAVTLDAEEINFVSKSWLWFQAQQVDILDNAISGLWLLPLTSGKYRKIVPQNPSSMTVLAPTGPVGELLRKLDASSYARPLINTKLIDNKSQRMIKEALGKDCKVLIKDGEDVHHFVSWLSFIALAVNNALDDEKNLVVKLTATVLSDKSPMMSAKDREAMLSAFQRLQIFKGFAWESGDGNNTYTCKWTSLSTSQTTIGLLDHPIALPPLKSAQILQAHPETSVKELFQRLGSMKCQTGAGILAEFVIPAWKNGEAQTWTNSCKKEVAAAILQHHSMLPLNCQKLLTTLPFIPVARENGEQCSTFSLASDIIDPSNKNLKSLFFDDEACVPLETFFVQFGPTLKICGMKSEVDEALVNSRALVYASKTYPLQETRQRVLSLLKASCRWDSELENPQLQELEWLPVEDSRGDSNFVAPKNCRGPDRKLLVSSQLPILEIFISWEWKRKFGWHRKLPAHILLPQLRDGLLRKDRAVVDAVLTHITKHGLVGSLVPELQKLPCVLTTNGEFVLTSKVFFPTKEGSTSCERLQPYLGNVDNKFWDDHKELLVKTGLRKGPGVPDLIDLQRILESKSSLSSADIAVAVECLNIASTLGIGASTDLKVLSNEGKFFPIRDIYYDDAQFVTGNKPFNEVEAAAGVESVTEIKPVSRTELVAGIEQFNFAHPDIPPPTIKRLGIEHLTERLKKDLLGIDDEDDEFDRKEQVTTGIVDTLTRYPIHTTFREYLANADDAQASRISWLLDESEHPRKTLLTPELTRHQGPALLVHNNGVFSKQDFEGFKNIGEGSKRQDENSIGQFGRGSQTMYHWTDVPMILSGEYLIILDPQRKVLQKSRLHRRRKAGVMLPLSKLKKALLYDQLAPFDGLWGYNMTLDYYPGTIFRFPLRVMGEVSALKRCEDELSSHETIKYLGKYFDEARISLLFLKQISSIDFSVRGKQKSGWSVERSTPPNIESRFSSYSVKCSFVNNMGLNSQIAGDDEWWVAISDLTKEADVTKYDKTAIVKKAECGLAALLQSESANSESGIVAFPTLRPRIFSTLPLSQASDLPVHIHATFLMSGDRKSLVVDEYEVNAEGTSWNKYLLEKALSTLYLTFLESLGSHPEVYSRKEFFEFWPQKCPPARSGSEVIHSSFWKHLSHSSHRLFPRADGSDEERLELLRIDEAIFDFLPKSQSEDLKTLLLSMKVRLARRVPGLIASKLLLIPELRFVTGSMLRDLFQLKDSGHKLQKEFIDNPKVLKSLLDLTISDEEDLRNLDGCHFLPLINGGFGVLERLPSPHLPSHSPYYYVTDRETADLFKVAAQVLVSPEYSKIFDRIANSRKYNLETLHHSHVSQLLKYGPAVVNKEAETWLEKFWRFWNSNSDLSRSLSSSLDCLSIFQAELNGTNMCVELSQIETLPAVVAPHDTDHRKLCEKVPGIYLFDSKFMSVKTQENEHSFKTGLSFCRFIMALVRRAAHQQKKLSTFVTENFDSKDLKVMRKLVIHHYDKNLEKLEEPKLHVVKKYVMAIPLWQGYDSDTRKFIAADDALVADDTGYVVPWMTDYSRFIIVDGPHTSNFLTNLGINKIKVEQLLTFHILPFPAISTSRNWDHYKALLAKMAWGDCSKEGSRIFPELLKARIAANGIRSFYRTCELFDHTEPIFVAAFRGLGTKFLHNDIQEFEHFWRRLGLRRRVDGYLQSADYLACMKAISGRLTNVDLDQDEELGNDTRAVLSPLLNPSSTTNRFCDGDWTSIAAETVFIAQINWTSEAAYRQELMTSVAASKRLLCLSEVISHDYVPICWSQTPFAIHIPTSEVLHKLGGKGRPTMVMVRRHLEHLSEMVPHLSWESLEGFLGDLKSTYEYLANHIEEAKTAFHGHDKVVWLNLDTFKASHVTLTDVQTAWTAITDLVLLSSCDAGRAKAVKPGLMQFQKLLSELGCASIVRPTVDQPTLHERHSLSASMRKLRDDGKLLDITYMTEGRIIRAHRVVLAGISEKCASQFKGNLMVEDVIKFDEEEDPDSFLTYHTLSTMINHAYEEEIDWSEMTATEDDDISNRADKLNLLLDLHGGADCWLIPALASQVEQKILENSGLLINIDNVVEVRERAEDVNAVAVETFCAKFIKENRSVVEMVESSRV